MTAQERDRAILGLKTLILVLAKRRLRSVPSSVQLDDLVSAGWIGAIEAVDRYDASKGKLSAFAEFRIRGAMNDYLRSVDPLSRDHRHELKAAGDTAPVTLSIESAVDKHDPSGKVLEFPDARSRDDFNQIESRHDLEGLYRRAHLKPQLKRVLRKYYRGGLTLKQIGKAEGVGECRAHQLRREALETLRLAA